MNTNKQLGRAMPYLAVLAMLLWFLLRDAKPAAVRLHGEPA